MSLAGGSKKRGREADGGSNETSMVRLNVGGRSFATSRATLTAVRGSVLAMMFEADSPYRELERDETGAVFLDSDPDAFPVILNYLRRGSKRSRNRSTESRKP